MNTILTLVFYLSVIGGVISGGLFLFHSHLVILLSEQKPIPPSRGKHIDLAVKSLTAVIVFALVIILTGSTLP